jgi:hypothetical protein
MTDTPRNDPAVADTLFQAILAEAGAALARPAAELEPLGQHLRRLAEDSLATAAALAEGRIGAEAARDAFQGRRDALLQLREFAELAALRGADSAADAIFHAIGRAVQERAGVDLAPLLPAG